MLSQSSTSSLNRRMEDSAIDPSRGTRKSQSRGFDYDPAGERTTAPVQKKKKDEIDSKDIINSNLNERLWCFSGWCEILSETREEARLYTQMDNRRR